MTAQASDTLLWEGDRWSILSGDGGLFKPGEYGIQPVMLHTAAWRSYVCTYAVRGGTLLLDRIEIGLDEASHARALAGEGPLVVQQLRDALRPGKR